MRRILTVFAITLLLCSWTIGEERIITMGYRTTNKLPYIAEEPDNSGFYTDLYSEACERIGFQLRIVRLPKKRVLIGLSNGSIDFYPGFAYNDERAQYSFWINTKLIQRDVAVSLDTLHQLTSFDLLQDLRYLKALGNPDYLDSAVLATMNVNIVAELDLERALSLIDLGRVDFYIYEENTMKYYVKSHGLTGFQFHENLIDRVGWMHAGFSRLSPHFEGIDNPSYDSTMAMSRENFPFDVVPESTVDRFRNALLEMYEEGYTDSLYQYHFE